MFITEKMHRVGILLPREDETKLWDKLGRFGGLHPGELRGAPRLQEYLSFVDLGELVASLREAAGFLNVDLEEPLRDPTAQPLELAELQQRLQELKAELDEARERFQKLRERQRALEKELDRLAVQRAHLELLRPLRIDIGALQRLERFVVIPGTLPRENLEQLELSLRELPHALLPYRWERRRVQLLAVTLKEGEEQFAKILESALFQPLELPARLSGLPEEALQQLARHEKELKEQQVQVERELAEFERWREQKRAELGDLLKINHKTIAALEQTGQTRAVSVAVGWVPQRELKRLERIVRAEPAWVLQTEELSYKRARDEYGLVPSKLSNPPFFRAFESLINVYGAPIYGGFDPTIIFALLFILIFGMMFGDLGHGLILFLLGLGLRFWPRFRVRPGLRRTGTILAAVGCSSMVFGTLYGSFFGYENMIPALWFHPMEHINRLLIYAVIVGVGAILIGIFVNIISKLIRGRYAELLFERSGVLGLWFYLGALVVVYLSTKGGTLGLPLIFVLMFLPLLLMPLERPFARRLQRVQEEGSEGSAHEQESGFTAAVTAAVDIFETLIVYLSNSISFVRVAAFALNHVALSLAIFQLGAMLRAFPLGGALYILTVALGNLVILILEGGIVAIQTLRLEFYEFFSKFFQEEGRPFRPFKFEFDERR